KYRRPPLTNRCVNCGGEIAQTVFRGAVEKYVKLVEDVLLRNVKDEYLRERVLIAIDSIRSIFEEEKALKEQASLEEFF
ncbi:MAG: hypothetical protein J7L83_04305, partial [Thaumarchaeota archaeon]|nr:hypothetical protein [Nitrososphaerota archaeon]